MKVSAYQLNHARDRNLESENARQRAKKQGPEERKRDGDEKAPPRKSRSKCVDASDTRSNRGYENEQIPRARHLVVHKHQLVVGVCLFMLGSRTFLEERAWVLEDVKKRFEIKCVAQCVAVEERNVSDSSGDAEVGSEKVAGICGGKKGQAYLLQFARIKLEGWAENSLRSRQYSYIVAGYGVTYTLVVNVEKKLS